jgi:hypothetical protein
MSPRTLTFALGALAGAAFAADKPVSPAPPPTTAPASSNSTKPSRRERERGNGKTDATAAAPAAARVDPNNYDAYRVIADRNIFNSTRTGRREREERPVRNDSIAFVGTMDYEKGLIAFFDGSDSSYRKVLRVGDSIDKFKITKISADRVELDREGKPTTMSLAQQMRRPEGGDWTLVGADVVRAEQAAAAAADASKNAAAAANVIPANASDALRKLMEARQKQLKQ